MPEAAAVAITEWIGEDFVFQAALSTALEVASAVSAVYTLRDQQRRADNAARNAYNGSLKDRYVMVRSTTEPRRVVLGRQRVSGPIAYIGSYGTNREHLTLLVILAAHEIDAVEAIYFDDELVTLDGSGNVVAVNRRDLFTLVGASSTFTVTSDPAAGTVAAYVDYGSTRVTLSTSVSGTSVTVTGGTVGATGTLTITYQPSASPWVSNGGAAQATTTVTLDGSGNGTVTFPSAPSWWQVTAIGGSPSDGYVYTSGNAYASLASATLTITGWSAQAGNTVYIDYSITSGAGSKARVRSYLGAAGQTADSQTISNLPGVWTSAHVMTGLAYLVVELDYDTDAFPSGLPQVSALVRGAKLYDPRNGTTAWSENPALMMRYVALSPLLGNLQAAQVNDASIIAAANICDGSVTYVVQGQSYTRALYTAGMVAKSGSRARDVLTDLATAMGGKWCFIDGMLRVHAGAYVTPLQTLDETWLVSGPSVQVQTKANRADVINTVTGRFVDQQRDYLEIDYPQVSDAGYIATDGQVLPLDMPLNAVTFVGQAQQVAAVAMRDARFGLRLVCTCNMRAYPVEVFDTLQVTLPRFGWVAKVFEVQDVAWTIDGGIQLTLKETDPSIWTLSASYSGVVIPPQTLFPSPWKVPAVTGLTCASGTNQLLKQADGTILSRVLVTWTSITDAFVTDGTGGVEVRWGLAGTAESTWQSVEQGEARSQLWLDRGIKDGSIIAVKARAFNALQRGPWCTPITHQVIGKTAAPSNVSGLTATQVPGGVQITWTPATDIDYQETELRYGASWGAGTRIFKGAAAAFLWIWPAFTTYTIYAKHRDTTGNESASASTVSITVDKGSLVTEVYDSSLVAGPVGYSNIG